MIPFAKYSVIILAFHLRDLLKKTTKKRCLWNFCKVKKARLWIAVDLSGFVKERTEQNDHG